METIQELAQQYVKWFETATRNNDTNFIRLKTEDENIKKLIYDAHDDMMPCDIKYQFIYDALEAIAEADDVDDIYLEADIYNRDLLNWVSSNLTRANYVDEAMHELGSEYPDLFTTLAMGQEREKAEVLASVRSSLEDILENLQEETI